MTYSIVARCPITGAMGVAVQSHWFNVGAHVPMIEPGVGAVATQSVTSRPAARAVLSSVRSGAPVDAALRQMPETDKQWRMRQLGVVDWQGNAASHTGSNCVPYAGSALGSGVACQANFMENEGVPEAMLKAWNDNSAQDIAARLLAALWGAESLGGDIRGRQSAALLVFDADASLVDPIFDLRVDDHHDPVTELARLVRIDRAYQRANKGDQQVAAGEKAAATEEYRAAIAMAPEIDELAFWHGIVLAESGDLDGAQLLLAKAYASRPQMRDLILRLRDAGWIDLSDEAAQHLTHG